MRKKLTTTTATYPLGLPVQSRLLTLPAGEFAGRRVALLQTAAGEIKLTWSDSPAVTWSPLQTIATDCADRAFDYAMAPNGDMHLAYVEEATGYMVTRRLQLVEGDWVTGDKVTMHNGAQTGNPSIAVDRNGRIWIAYSRFSTPTRTIYLKSSTDSGATWGTNADNPGTEISHAAMQLWSRTLCGGLAAFVFYADQDSGLYMRTCPISGNDWTEPQLVAAGSHLTRDFDVTFASDGRLGVVFRNNELYFREFDGNLWGSLIPVDDAGCICPQLRYRHATPLVTWLKSFVDLLVIPMYALKRGSGFTTPAVLDHAVGSFTNLLLYCHATQSYVDRTTQAFTYNVADISHPDSGAMLADVNDVCYAGMDSRFNQINISLATAGAGGAVSFAYWNGAQWQSFTPEAGGNTLDAAENELLLWADHASTPGDWQKCGVDGRSGFWVRITVTSDFSTPPVGTYINAASDIRALMLGR